VAVEDRTFLFRRSQESSSPVMTLEYGLDFDRFSARMTALTEGSVVEVRGWDVKNKAEIISSAAGGSETSLMKEKSSGFAMSEKAFGPSPTSLVDAAVVDAAHAEALAKAAYNRRLKEFISAEGSISGNPGIRAGKTISIKGVGSKFSGVYYVVATTHAIDGRNGYATSFRMRRTAL
jgi:uncharacterized protein